MASPTRTSSDEFIYHSPRSAPPIESFDPVAMQVGFLKELVEKEDSTPKQKQASYQSTIMLCLNLKNEDQAILLLNETEEKNIYADAPEARAKLFFSVIANLIANGCHAKADEVFQFADSKGVWKNFPDQRNSAIQELQAVGFIF